jgi:tetratricopeptide (TPR) repeat protein
METLDRLQTALAGRYAIEGELGRGGMALVFRARDLRHDRLVALKVVRPELASVVGRERFLREIQVAAKLQHANIVPVHDSGEADNTLYYVMPYVEGESLGARLRREGQLPIDDALEIARDVASALSYAHDRNIVHRDIKPENILLSGGRALVADFGIARAFGVGADARLTETGLAIGTPAYMSPEQATGSGELDARTDIYALGCVLYEMLAGEAPYTGPSAQAILAKRFIEPIPHVRTVRESVPPGLEQAITKALAKTPVDRFQTAAELTAALTPEALSAARIAPEPIAPAASGGGLGWRRWRWAFAALAGVIVAGAAALAVRRSAGVAPAASRVLPADARRVVVAVFANKTGDPSLDPLGDIAADYLARGLAQTQLVEVIDARAEQAGDSAAHSRGVAGARALARTVGAGNVVWGAYYLQGDSLQFQAQLTDAATGELAGAALPAVGPARERTRGVEVLRQHVVATLADRMDPRFAKFQRASASQPASYEAYREFLAGDDIAGIPCPESRDCGAEALGHYWNAYALDSSFTLPVVAIAEQSGLHGNCARTDSIADGLRPRYDRLLTSERARLDWVVAACHGQRAAAQEASRQLMAASPRSDRLTLNDAALARQSGRLRAAIAAMEKLDPARHEHDRQYWGNLITPYHLLGEYQRELDAVQRARRFLPADLEMLSFEARALVGLGRVSAVNARLDEMERASAPPDAPVSFWIDNVGRELRAHGHGKEAKAVFERGLRRYRALPREQQQKNRGDLALFLDDVGRYDEAWPVLKQVAAENPDDVAWQGALGALAARRRDKPEVQRIDRWLADRKGGLPFGAGGAGDAALWRALVAAAGGDRDQAVAQYRVALERGAEEDLRYSAHADSRFESVRDYPPFRELTRSKD